MQLLQSCEAFLRLTLGSRCAATQGWDDEIPFGISLTNPGGVGLFGRRGVASELASQQLHFEPATIQ